MHSSWFIYLFIFLLCSLSSSGKSFSSSRSSSGNYGSDISSDDVYDEEDDDSTTVIISTTTGVAWHLELPAEVEDHDYDVKLNHIETTPITVKTSTTSHFHHYDDPAVYDHHEVESEEENVSSTTYITKTTTTTTTTRFSSSFSNIRLTTNTTTETPTTTKEIPLRQWNVSFPSDMSYYSYRWFHTTTLDPIRVAAFLAKTNRDRLLLKIFVIAAVVGMCSLAMTLIIIHIIRNTRRYRGYRTPANASASEKSKHLSDIKA